MLDLLRTLIPSLAVRDIELSAHSFAECSRQDQPSRRGMVI